VIGEADGHLFDVDNDCLWSGVCYAQATGWRLRDGSRIGVQAEYQRNIFIS